MIYRGVEVEQAKDVNKFKVTKEIVENGMEMEVTWKNEEKVSYKLEDFKLHDVLSIRRFTKHRITIVEHSSDK